MTTTPLSAVPRQQEVLERICEAIADAREDWSYPTDCFCHTHSDGWNYEFSQDFLDGLDKAIREFVASYEKGRMLG